MALTFRATRPAFINGQRIGGDRRPDKITVSDAQALAFLRNAQRLEAQGLVESVLVPVDQAAAAKLLAEADGKEKGSKKP